MSRTSLRAKLGQREGSHRRSSYGGRVGCGNMPSSELGWKVARIVTLRGRARSSSLDRIWIRTFQYQRVEVEPGCQWMIYSKRNFNRYKCRRRSRRREKGWRLLLFWERERSSLEFRLDENREDFAGFSGPSHFEVEVNECFYRTGPDQGRFCR